LFLLSLVGVEDVNCNRVAQIALNLEVGHGRVGQVDLLLQFSIILTQLVLLVGDLADNIRVKHLTQQQQAHRPKELLILTRHDFTICRKVVPRVKSDEELLVSVRYEVDVLLGGVGTNKAG
jgi:hypothetical protein